MTFVNSAVELGLDGLATLDTQWLLCWGVGMIDFDLDRDLDVHMSTHEELAGVFLAQRQRHLRTGILADVHRYLSSSPRSRPSVWDQDTQVDSIEVVFPDGMQASLASPEVNNVVSIWHPFLRP